MSKNPFLIAEIGINHNGDIEIAKKLIKISAEAGFDAVKFQKRDIDLVYGSSYLDQARESPWGNTQRDQKQGLEFGKEEFDQINKFSNDCNIEWFASAWDLNSQDFLSNYNLNYNKVASAMIGHKPLLRKIAKEGKKTFISTGMSTMEEIKEAVKIFTDEKCPFELMHCNSTYPMKEGEANIKCIQTLKEQFNCDVGYSGHESSLIKVSICAVCYGATSIERHITLDRTMYGSDQAASIESHSLSNFVDAIRMVPKIIGNGEKKIQETEIPIREKLKISVDE